MPELHDRVVAALDSHPPEDGVIVVKDGRRLAARDPAPGGACTLVVLDAEPFAYPSPPRKGVREGDPRVIERPAQGADPDPKRDR